MHKSRPSKDIRILVAISFIVMVAVNALANILPINGLNTGEVSDSYSNLFAPAGLTFAIWGVIYILLAGYALFQAGLFHSHKDQISRAAHNRIGLFFALSSFANAGWIFAWHYGRIGVSLLLMAVILLSLIAINLGLRNRSLSAGEKLLVRLPFSVYFGWITVATIANITAFLVGVNWTGFGISESVWMVLITVIATIIGILTIVRNRDFAYGLVFLWAYYGIWFKHTSEAGFQGQYPLIIATLIVCFILIALTILSLFFFKKKRTR